MALVKRFEKGTSTYTCRCCKKTTRDTGIGEKGVQLCAFCYEEAGWENSFDNNECTEEEFDAAIAELKQQYGRA